jgi:peptidoglycan hydrolase-like protein with peptidoglycan-binding domain
MGKRLMWLFVAATLLLGLFPVMAQASNNSGILKIGDQDEYVQELQTRLHELGYFPDSPTGYFGIVTQQAVINYQQDNHLTVDGKAGPQTLRSLLGDNFSAPKTDLEALNSNTYYPGDKGDAVAELQKRLACLEYYDYGSITGYYGPVTRLAVERFQRVNGLKPDGIAGPDTISKLQSGHAAYLCLYVGDRGRDVEKLQSRLAGLGYFSGNITGYYGTKTESAVKEFQAKKGLIVDGKAGKSTRSLLNSSDAPVWDGINRIASAVSSTTSASNVDKMLQSAISLLGEKYAYHTEGPATFDSSGFIYYVLRSMGIVSARYNATGFARVDSWEKISDFIALKRGDILFFSSETGENVVHTGIYLGDGKFIHSSASAGSVIISSLDGWFKDHFCIARRIF